MKKLFISEKGEGMIGLVVTLIVVIGLLLFVVKGFNSNDQNSTGGQIKNNKSVLQSGAACDGHGGKQSSALNPQTKTVTITCGDGTTAAVTIAPGQ